MYGINNLATLYRRIVSATVVVRVVKHTMENFLGRFRSHFWFWLFHILNFLLLRLLLIPILRLSG